MGYSFLSPKILKAASQPVWCTKHFHRISWSSGHEKHIELEKILKKLRAPETEFFAKAYEKCKILSEIWKQRLQTWMTTHAQKFRISYSKTKNLIGGVATTHFVMQKLLTVQKEKQLHTEN